MFVGDQNQADAEEKGEENHLQHPNILTECEEDVLGHDIHQGLEGSAFAHLLDGVGAVGHLLNIRSLEVRADFWGERGARLEDVDHDEPDGDRENCREEIDRNGPAPHPREFADIGQGGDAGDQGGKDQRHGDQLEEVDEEGAKGRHPMTSEFTQTTGGGHNPEGDPETEADHDLPMQFQFHAFVPFPWFVVCAGWAEAYAGWR